MESLKRQLNDDEDRELRRGHTPPHAVTPSTFIGNAIKIEEQQYVPTPCTAPIEISNLST